MKAIRLKYLKNKVYFRFCNDGDLMQKICSRSHKVLYVNKVNHTYNVVGEDTTVFAFLIMATSDYQKGINDCKAGIYDTFYRYNRDDDGYLYNEGWEFQNLETQNESVVII